MADYDVTLRTGLDTKDVEAQASKLRSRIEDIFNKTDGKKMSSSFVRLKQNLRDLYTESERISGEIAKLDAQKFEVVTTKEYSDSVNRLQKLDAELDRIKAKMQEVAFTKGVGSTQFGNLAHKQAYLTQERTFEEAERLRLEGLGKKEIKIPIRDTQHYQDLVAQQAKLNDKIQIGTLRMKEMQNTARQTVHPFREMRSAVSKVGHAIGKVVSGVKTLINRLRGVNTGFEDTQKSMRNLLKFALKYFLGLRSIFILYKRIRSAGVEAYKGLASQFPELNAELNQLKNSFFQLKNSIATMAQPILSYLVPAIQTLMSWLSAAMNALANFFAILTGSKYVYKSAKANKDWAKSASGAGKAAEKANEDIAEYDNLILIQQENDNNGGGGGGAADEYAGAWEKVEAESDFAQKIKDAINQGNWEEVGALFADKLNGVVSKFDSWIDNVLRPKGKKWSERIARILNGFTDRFDGKKLGETLANAVNTAFDIVNTFLKTYDFRKLGTRVGELITGFFKKLDPKLIGNTLANRFNAAINFWAGLIKSTDFKIIGSRIGVALKTLIEDIEWAQLGANLSNLAAGILEGLSQFIIDSDLGVTVGNAINEFLSKIDFGRLMRDLSELAINILSALADAIETIDWEMVGQAIADMLKNIDWGRFLSVLLKVALGLIKGLGTALLQIATDSEALGSLATGLLAIFGAKWIWKKITGIFTSGLTSAISGGLSSAGGAVSGWLSRVFTTNLGTGAAGFVGSIAQGLIGGAATFQGVGSIAGSVGSVLANLWSQDDALVAEYQKFSKNAIGYTIDAVKESVEAFSEYSETTGKTTLQNAIGDMFGGVDPMEVAKEKAAEMQEASELLRERAMLGWSTEKGGLGRDVTDIEWFAYKYGEAVEEMGKVSQQLAENTDSAFSGVGKSISNLSKEMQGAVDEGRKSLGYYQTDSNHYAEIAKANAQVVKDTAKEATDTANHYAEIAKQNSGYYDRIRQQAEETSNHYVQIAQANAKAVVNTTKEMEDSSNHYVQIAKANAGIVVDEAQDMAVSIENAVTGIPDSYDKTFTSAFDKIANAFGGTKSFFQEVAEGVKAPFGTMGEYFDDTFSTAWGNVVDVFQTDTPQFQSIQDSISGSFKTMINGMISGVNSSITSPFQTLSNLINKMKGLDVGGSKVFANLPSIIVPKIPKLAQGAVLPPNNPFIAMVGDQKSGTNIETPLSTMVEAFREAMQEYGGANSNQPIVLNLNGKQIAQAVWDEENKRYKQTGMRFKFS